MKIIITTHRKQNRKHHKRRINKKWAKRYGFTETEIQEKGKPIYVPARGGYDILYLTYEDFCRLTAVAPVANEVYGMRW